MELQNEGTRQFQMTSPANMVRLSCRAGGLVLRRRTCGVKGETAVPASWFLAAPRTTCTAAGLALVTGHRGVSDPGLWLQRATPLLGSVVHSDCALCWTLCSRARQEGALFSWSPCCEGSQVISRSWKHIFIRKTAKVAKVTVAL